MSENESIKVFTLRATCKKCGVDFTYERVGTLIGAERSVCDACRAARNTNRPASPRWSRVVSED